MNEKENNDLYLNEILKNINPFVELDPLSNDFLLEIADNFIDSTMELAAELVRSKGEKEIKGSDIEYVLKSKFGEEMFHESTSFEKKWDHVCYPNERHLKRMKAIQDNNKLSNE